MSRPDKPLSPCQAKVIDFICDEIARLGGRPTQTEIGDEFGISRQAATKHVDALVTKGYLLKSGGRLEPTNAAWNRQLLRSQEKQARARLPRGALSGGTARAICAVRSVMRGLGQESQQLVLDFAAR